MSKHTEALQQLNVVQTALTNALPGASVTMNTAADFLGHLDALGLGIRNKAENAGRPKLAKTEEKGSKGAKS